MRYRFIALLLATPFLGLAPHCLAGPRPNIVLVMTDDQGYGDFGFAGNTVIETPHLDAMAARSVHFTQFYVSPVCSPTRASLLTGRYNYRTRVVDTTEGRAMMAPDEQTVAEILRDAGYATGLFGKWHIGENYPMRPTDQGFDEVLSHRGGALGFPANMGSPSYRNPVLFENNVEVQLEGYVTDILFDAAFEFMEENVARGQSFFAYIPTNAPHFPFGSVPEDWYQHYLTKDLSPGFAPEAGDEISDASIDKLARIYAMESNIDENMGRLFAELERLGISDDTIVLFLTDNGPDGIHFVGDLRGSKGSVLDGGIRTPLLVHWPSRLGSGRTVSQLSAHIDVLPTLLELTGVPAPSNVTLDGSSLVPLLEDENAPWPERLLFFQWHRGNAPEPRFHFSVRSEQWKLVSLSDRPGDNPITFTKGQRPIQLFFVPLDPGERNDVAHVFPGITQELTAAYDDWFLDVSSTREDNFAPPRIQIGTPFENPVLLSRQAWRDGSALVFLPRAKGTWLVNFAKSGDYRVRTTFNSFSDPATITVRTESVIAQDAVEPMNGIHTFEDLAIPEGDAALQVEIFAGDVSKGANFVSIEKVPLAVADVVDAVLEDSAENPIDVLSNDRSDANGSDLIISAVSGTSAGSLLSITSDGRALTYSPRPDFVGEDTFTYRIEDSQGRVDTARVAVMVDDVNDPPLALNDAVDVEENSADNELDVLANDLTHPDEGEVLRIVQVSTPAQGSVNIVDESRILYSPPPGFIGVDEFEYTIDDGKGAISTAAVSVRVRSEPCSINELVIVTPEPGAELLVEPGSRETTIAFEAQLNCPQDLDELQFQLDGENVGVTGGIVRSFNFRASSETLIGEHTLTATARSLTDPSLVLEAAANFAVRFLPDIEDEGEGADEPPVKKPAFCYRGALGDRSESARRHLGDLAVVVVGAMVLIAARRRLPVNE